MFYKVNQFVELKNTKCNKNNKKFKTNRCFGLYKSKVISGKDELEIPFFYGQNEIVLCVQDTYKLYTYWEIPQWKKEQYSANIESWELGVKVLRVYYNNVEHNNGKIVYFDIKIGDENFSWYINLNKPNHLVWVELGIITSRLKYITLAKSNKVQTPPNKISDIIDMNWLGYNLENYIIEEENLSSLILIRNQSSYNMYT